MPVKAKTKTAAKQATKNASIQAFDGMGALVTKGGTNFRVWAPNADAVHMTGSFTDWEQPGVPLESEGNGNWAGFVKGAKAGDPYKFHLKNGSNEFLKADPRAREIDPYTGNGVICQDSFDWGDDHFQTPPLNEVVLYELHVGTFGGGRGQEFLEDGWFDDHEMLDWAKKSEFRGIHRAFSDLIRLRRNLDGKTRGLQGQHVDVFHQNHAGKVLAWHRWYDGGPGDSTVVLLNCTAKAYDLDEIALPAGGEWNVRFNADWNGYSKDFGNTEVLTVDSRENEVCHPGPLGGLKLPPYGLIILSQD